MSGVCGSGVVDGTGGGDCETGPGWTEDHQAYIALPSVRNSDWHMDSCAATNKSQYCFGAMGLMLACGILDVLRSLFMVPGHTKFGPDLVSRAEAGDCNKRDVFNQAMLAECAQKYACTQVYNEMNLFHWKKATIGMFAPVDGISTYRYFLWWHQTPSLAFSL